MSHDFYIKSDFTLHELNDGNPLAVLVCSENRKVCKLCGAVEPTLPCPKNHLKLKDMFEAIRAQQLTRGIDYSKATLAARKAYASECALALHVEVSELASSWAFASWKTTKTDEENIKREIVDCFFFLANIAASFDIKTEDLEKMFFWVLDNNAKRIANGVHKEVDLATKTTKL